MFLLGHRLQELPVIALQVHAAYVVGVQHGVLLQREPVLIGLRLKAIETLFCFCWQGCHVIRERNVTRCPEETDSAQPTPLRHAHIQQLDVACAVLVRDFELL